MQRGELIWKHFECLYHPHPQALKGEPTGTKIGMGVAAGTERSLIIHSRTLRKPTVSYLL